MKLYQTPAQKMDSERREPTAAQIQASLVWQSLPEEDRKKAHQQVADVMKSKLWLKEREAFYATLSDIQLIAYRKKYLQK